MTITNFHEAMQDLKTERPITHVITIPSGMVAEQPSQGDLGLLLNRAVSGLMHAACAANLVPAYIGQPSILPVEVAGLAECLEASEQQNLRDVAAIRQLESALATAQAENERLRGALEGAQALTAKWYAESSRIYANLPADGHKSMAVISSISRAHALEECGNDLENASRTALGGQQ
ncbi:hypothetical protein [Deinococcus multiflagellatus]|uniref:hypothetical protein n=1 Tax=Deinococcus multiflagellatus TaxID=1656887 RepID=UPI001CCB5CF6|nr:hypothetical protein [Deinococcus multiflagellatus]MBZ9712157.1 hypothetical protein [Deinococcus multiflagellatus]